MTRTAGVGLLFAVAVFDLLVLLGLSKAKEGIMWHLFLCRITMVDDVLLILIMCLVY